MPIRVSRTSDVRKFISLFCACSLALGTCSAWAAPHKKAAGRSVKTTAKNKSGTTATAKNSPQVAGNTKTATRVTAKEWGPYLDVAYELSYWEKGEIKEWREKRDKEIGESLTSYITTWSPKLMPAQEPPAKERKEEQLPAYRERDYLRLAIAHTIDYLQSDNAESINSATKVLDKLKGKSAMPEIAFWSGFAKALLALEHNDSEQFVTQVYDIWNNSVVFIEQNELARSAANPQAVTTTPYYYRNLINLVVNRAIIARKQENLNALGPLFMMMKDRNLGEKDGEGKYTTTLIQRICDGFTAPDSDRYRLNFTVALIESKRLQQIAYAKLDAEGMSEAARKPFEQSRVYNDLAFKWAASRRSSGVVMAAVDYLDTSSFAIQRLPDNEKAPAYKYFVSLPGQEGAAALLRTMAIYNDIATYSTGGWDKVGYQSRDLYLKSTHRLWRAIMELSLWSGDFYLTKLNAAKDSQSIHAYAAPMQVSLDSYLDFLATQLGRGYNDIIPNSAYFGAAEAAEKLAFAYNRVNSYSSDNSAYNLWFSNRLQATELFPFSPREVRQTAVALKQDGRYDLYLDYFLPLASRMKQSPAIARWLEEQKSDSATVIRDYVNGVEKLFGAGPEETSTSSAVESAYVKAFQPLREELQRKPDHPVHALLKSFYLEELSKSTPFTQILKAPVRLDH